MTRQMQRERLLLTHILGCTLLLLPCVQADRAVAQDAEVTGTITVETIGADSSTSVECEVRALVAAAFDFAFNRKTGELAAIETEFGRLRVYPAGFMNSSTAVEPRTVTVGTRPVAVILKEYQEQSYYIVACETDSELVVLDATTLDEVNRSRLPARDLTRLWTSQNPDDPNVYYSYQVPGVTGARKINAETWEDAGLIVDPGTLFAVSGDGRRLSISGENGNWARSLTIDGDRVIRTDPSRCTLQSHANICYSDPHGRFLFIGQRFPFPRIDVMRPDLSRQVNMLDYAILGFAREEPWLVGYRSQGTNASFVFAEYHSLGPLFELGFRALRWNVNSTIRRFNWQTDGRHGSFAYSATTSGKCCWSHSTITSPLYRLPIWISRMATFCTRIYH